MSAKGRGGSVWRRITKPIREQATNCWRCGKSISNEYKWPHPRSVTIGHMVALEDGGPPEDPHNLAAECITCNMGDGARRTNSKRHGFGHGFQHGFHTPPTTWHNPHW